MKGQKQNGKNENYQPLLHPLGITSVDGLSHWKVSKLDAKLNQMTEF